VLDKATTACAQSVKGNTLDQVCTSGLCSAAAAGSGASNAEYGRLGALIASYVSKYGKSSPASADAIQACVVAGPAVLVAAFQNALGGDVAAIGQAKEASPQ
jgi:hypothetical protein